MKHFVTYPSGFRFVGILEGQNRGFPSEVIGKALMKLRGIAASRFKITPPCLWGKKRMGYRVGPGLLCALLWGLGYSALRPVAKELSSFVINILYGSAIVLTNTVALFVDRKEQMVTAFAPLATHAWLPWGLAGYIACFITAQILYQVALRDPTVVSGILTALTSSYPIVSVTGGLLLYQELTLVNLPLLGLGMTGLLASTVVLIAARS